MKPLILVTGAAGNTGFPTVKTLLKLGFPVRAFIRSENETTQEIKRLGAELFVGDMYDIRDLRKSMDGVKRAYYFPPTLTRALFVSTSFAIAAEEKKLEHVVVMTQWLSSNTHPSQHTKEHWLSDKIFRMSPNVKYIFVNPGYFAANYFLFLEFIAQTGIMAWPFGDGLNAPPSNEDIGAVVAHILKDPVKHEGKIYRPTGPKLLSPQQMADIIGEALGRKVEYKNIPDEMFLKTAEAVGMPKSAYSEVYYYNQDTRNNAWSICAPTNVVKEITGNEAEDFKTIAKRYVENKPPSSLTLGNEIKAVLEHVQNPATPVPDIKKYQSDQNYPKFKNMSLSSENDEWIQEHKTQNELSDTKNI